MSRPARQREKGEHAWLADRLETRARAYLREKKQPEAKRAAEEAFALAYHGFDEGTKEQCRKTLNLCFEVQK